MALRSMLGLTEPHTFELVDQRLATVMAAGEREDVTDGALRALYASVNELRKQRPFELEPLRARWPAEKPAVPRSDRPAMWGLPVPSDVTELPQVDPEHTVRINVWEYGLVAEVLHEGSRAEEGRAIERLRRYIEESGLDVVGSHEEEYLSSPEAAIPKTLIRYRVRRR